MAYPRDLHIRVAGPATNEALGAGANGDELEGFLVIPTSTSPGAITIKDGAGADGLLFAGGDSSVASLVPFPIWYKAASQDGGWSISVGADLEVVVFGKFTL